MANSGFLRKNINQHTVKNTKSKTMDSDIDIAINTVHEYLTQKYPTLTFELTKKILLSDLISQLKKQFPKYSSIFTSVHETSSIKPDGGLLYAVNKNGERRLILVSEIKRQGTNDARAVEGLPKQAQGNAIERLGKNVIGIRALCKTEGIFPFVCFGSGHDFRDESSIVDRVKTINDFFPLNKIFVVKNYPPFEPGSFFFRTEPWKIEEMVKIMIDVAEQSIHYKFV